MATGSACQTYPAMPAPYQAEGRGDLTNIATVRTAPCLAAWSSDPGAQTARQSALQWFCGPAGPVTPDKDPAASAATVMMLESQASQVVEILGEIAEASRAQRRSAAELEQERHQLAAREAALRSECEEAQGFMKRLQAEVEQKQSARFEAESLSAELDEERQKSHAQRQAARRMRQRFERRIEEQAEELRRVLETAEYRERVQEATIGDLERRLSLVREAEEQKAASRPPTSSGQDGTLQALPLVLEAPIHEGSMPSALESTRRRLFSPTVVLTPTSTTGGEMVGWLFENTIEHSISTGSLLATSNIEPLVTTSNLEPLTEKVQENPEAATAEPSAQPKTPKEAPPVGLVAEKVSIFEQRCHTPTQGVPAALRRGPRSVPTPFGSSRVWQDEGRPSAAGERIGATPGFLRTSCTGPTSPLRSDECGQRASTAQSRRASQVQALDGTMAAVEAEA
uniref:Uncharacterized protein n=1 Tax=Alexandrium andersonii TaxID=327968 RepID=A0A7S2DRG9_9DINO|mmetsp:Transcript_58519/g.131625  ORF Transcript_58519/g.131625 Transcript_58519/m.131625 type:complete len:455 (+) Transcript_58519:108-1472(+)